MQDQDIMEWELGMEWKESYIREMRIEYDEKIANFDWKMKPLKRKSLEIHQ